MNRRELNILTTKAPYSEVNKSFSVLTLSLPFPFPFLLQVPNLTRILAVCRPLPPCSLPTQPIILPKPLHIPEARVSGPVSPPAHPHWRPPATTVKNSRCVLQLIDISSCKILYTYKLSGAPSFWHSTNNKLRKLFFFTSFPSEVLQDIVVHIELHPRSIFQILQTTRIKKK